MLPVSEVYGPVLQGEGPRAGRACGFVRFGGCNLSCSWCDSPYTWDASRYDLRTEITQWSVADILHDARDWPEVILTGGEPLMHQKNPDWGPLLRGFFKMKIPIAVETNGTIAPTQSTATLVHHYSISPKLGNSGEHKKNQNTEVAVWPDEAKSRSILKFVVTCADDVYEAAEIGNALGWTPDKVWVMPEGVTREAVLASWQIIFETAAQLGINASQRLHVLAFDDKRKV